MVAASPVPPEGAPNVVIVLLDDVGYAQFGAYGSDIATPTFDRLAAQWSALCELPHHRPLFPHAGRLLTGRNHHSNGMARVVEIATGFPGYDATIPKENGFLSEILRLPRLRHLRRRQVAPHPGRTDGGGEPQGQVAARSGLRPLLRIHGRRDRPVPPRPRLRQPARSTPPAPRRRATT